jgi:two-component system, NtrC family, response regulator AtoC
VVMRLGAVKPKAVDVRFIAASHRSLEAEVQAGRLRQDLFFRVNGITLKIPALRERGAAEIERLATSFLPPDKTLSAPALSALVGHDWPGNVRELKNVVARAALLSADAPEIDATHIDLGPTPEEPVVDDERQRVVDALTQAAGNQTRAAQILGVSRRTLVTKIETYGLLRPRKR